MPSPFSSGNYYERIKTELENNEVYKKAKDYSKNKNDLSTYYNVGKLLSEANNQYGEGVIKEYSNKLTKELGKGYSQRNLYNMKLFHEKMQTVSAKLSWSHYCEILSINNTSKYNYYLKITEKQNLSVRQLRNKIKNNEYERLEDNTKLKLINTVEDKVEDLIKNPILIKNSYGFKKVSEKLLKQLIIEDLDNFLTELGDGFTYIKNEYKIKLGDKYNYIDLLLYNIKFNCYVVIELKVTELKAEHIGQISKYINYIDKNIKKLDQEKSIGIVICKKNDQFVMEYCSDDKVLCKEYSLN